MIERLNRFLDFLSEAVAERKGMLPLFGLVLIGLNFVFRLVDLGWISDTDFFLHLGLGLTIVGFLLARAL